MLLHIKDGRGKAYQAVDPANLPQPYRSAPELLASLKDAVAPFARDTSPPRWVAIARAAIAKAEAR